MRPQFHFTAQTGWINDPHGITFHRGTYHLFYQYLPDQLEWGWQCQWGHATSADLITFEHRPSALSPGEGDDGIWTGSVVVHNDAPTLFYTAVSATNLDAGRVRIAHPLDDRWDAWAKGPVVVDTPDDPSIVAFRDPCVSRNQNQWQMFVGASSAGGEPLALRYASDDGLDWSAEGSVLAGSDAAGHAVSTGTMWECPQFFELDGHHVMMTSVMDAGSLTHSIYALGEWVDGQFSAKAWGQLSFGTSYYAPSFFRDAKGQPSVLFWMRNIGGTGDGWIGAHSLPFRLQVTNGALVARPSEALVGYRGELSPTGQVDGLAADVLWSSAGTLTIRSGGVEVASVVVKDSTLTLSCDGESWSMPQGASDIRVIADGPVLEVISETGLIGCPVTPAGSNLEFSIDGGQVSVWPLRHPATH